MTRQQLRDAGIKGGQAPKHHWTDAELEIVRQDYKGTGESAAAIADKLQRIFGGRFTKCGVKGQCAKLGIQRHKAPDWTDEDEDRLRELLPRKTVSQLAKLLHRSPNGIVNKIKRLGLFRRDRDGWYTKKDVCEILGVDHHIIQRFIDDGQLKARWRGDQKPTNTGSAMWYIEEKHLKLFIINHALDFQGRNVDLFSVIAILVPGSRTSC